MSKGPTTAIVNVDSFESFEYSLVYPIIMNPGRDNEVQIETLEVCCPSYKNALKAMKVKQVYLQAMFSFTNSLTQTSTPEEMEARKHTEALKKLEKKSPEELRAEEKEAIEGIIPLMYGSKDFDIESFLTLFCNLLTSSGCCKIGKLGFLLRPHFDHLHMDDIEGLAGEYIHRFLT